MSDMSRTSEAGGGHGESKLLQLGEPIDADPVIDDPAVADPVDVRIVNDDVLAGDRYVPGGP
jgi:hypothetical protein